MQVVCGGEWGGIDRKHKKKSKHGRTRWEKNGNKTICPSNPQQDSFPFTIFNGIILLDMISNGKESPN